MILTKHQIAIVTLDGHPGLHTSSFFAQDLSSTARAGTADEAAAPPDALTGRYLTSWFRALSAGMVVKHYPFCALHIDFSAEGGAALQRAVALASHIPVYSDHDQSVEQWLGKTIGAEWTPAVNGEQVPGLSTLFRLWTGIDAAGTLRSQRHYLIAEGVRQETVSRVSAGLMYRYERSHPALDEQTFFRMMGEVVDGTQVRLIVSDILQFIEFSLVQMGADPNADRERNREMQSAFSLGDPIHAVLDTRNGLEFAGTKTYVIPPNAATTQLAVATVQVNPGCLAAARKLIAAGRVQREGPWEMTAADENALLGDPPDWKAYAAWFLGVDPTVAADVKAHYKYPFGKGGDVWRAALIAARSRSGQFGHEAIFDAAGVLLEQIDAQAEDDDDLAAKPPAGSSKGVQNMGEDKQTTPAGTLPSDPPVDVQLTDQAVDAPPGTKSPEVADTPTADAAETVLRLDVTRLTRINQQLDHEFTAALEKYGEAVQAAERTRLELATAQAMTKASEQQVAVLQQEVATLRERTAALAERAQIGDYYLAQLRRDVEQEYLVYCAGVRGVSGQDVSEAEHAQMLAHIKEVATFGQLQELQVTYGMQNRARLPAGRQSLDKVAAPAETLRSFGNNVQYLYR